jgi:hypothetical protein
VNSTPPGLTPAQMSQLGSVLAAEGVFFLAFIALSIYVNWRIAVKAGYQGAYSLLMLVPLVNLVVYLIFAFTDWPIEKELKAARAGDASRTWQPPAVN